MNIGEKYDDIAQFWTERHFNSDYGVAQFERALSYAPNGGKALDVGCGSGGRFIKRLEARSFQISGVDASKNMINLARSHHPRATFHHADIQDWRTEESFDFIVAWDCLFHLPLSAQKPVLRKLCNMLNEDGVLIHSFGNATGYKNGEEWRGYEFRYSSIGISENLRVMMENGVKPVHLELDQFPEAHVCSIAIKTAD